jgi:hypothetical protein
VGVERAGAELLPRAALALDEDRGARLRRALDETQHAQHRRAARDQAMGVEAGAHGRVERRHVGPASRRSQVGEGATAEDLAHDAGNDLRERAVLHDVVGGAELHRVDGDGFGARAGHHHHRQVGACPPQLAEAGEPVGVGQAVVEHDARDGGVGRGGERLSRGRCEADVPAVAGAAQRPIEAVAGLGVVVDDQDDHGGPIAVRLPAG